MRHGVRHLVRSRRRKARVRRVITISRLILEELAYLGETAVSSFFPRRYPEARIWRELLGFDGAYRFSRESFSVLLSRLKAQGLVERVGGRVNARWRLTPEGQSAVAENATQSTLARPDGIRRIVVFDIPERERKKRDAIRYELMGAGFTQLQKSVWWGSRPLPEEFAILLDALGLRKQVHIFSVAREGTLGRRPPS